MDRMAAHGNLTEVIRVGAALDLSVSVVGMEASTDSVQSHLDCQGYRRGNPACLDLALD